MKRRRRGGCAAAPQAETCGVWLDTAELKRSPAQVGLGAGRAGCGVGPDPRPWGWGVPSEERPAEQVGGDKEACPGGRGGACRARAVLWGQSAALVPPGPPERPAQGDRLSNGLDRETSMGSFQAQLLVSQEELKPWTKAGAVPQRWKKGRTGFNSTCSPSTCFFLYPVPRSQAESIQSSSGKEARLGPFRTGQSLSATRQANYHLLLLQQTDR